MVRAQVHAKQQGYPVEILLQGRLYPDMYDLIRQIQITTDISRRGVARLASQDAPVMADNETTLPPLQERINVSIAYIESFTSEDLDGAERRKVAIPIPASMGGGFRRYQGADFVRSFILPNVYFHCSMAYAILRHNGTCIGKADFLGMQPTPRAQNN